MRSHRGLVGKLAGYIDETFDEESGGYVFRSYLRGVIDTVEATFGEDAVDEVLAAVSAGARRDWIAESTSPYGREDY